VILAILAAIAIPALTGYIDKAEDKKYISEARSTAVAIRTVLNDAYGKGMFGSLPPAAQTLFTDGTPQFANNSVDVYNIASLGYGFLFYEEACDLMGTPYRQESEPGGWIFYPVAPHDSGYTALSAPGWIRYYHTKGNASTEDELILVTYGLNFDETGIKEYQDFHNALVGDKFAYSDDAGYKVCRIRG
jgi:type II secretory pathway pseudopilin PulG